jgi:hypothetical protein
MGVLNINDIQVGMVLEGDVINFQGTVLISAGATLTEKHLKALRAWGITEAKIVGISPADLEEKDLELVDEERRELVERELAYLFQKTNAEDPVMAEIYRLVMKRRLDRLWDEKETE